MLDDFIQWYYTNQHPYYPFAKVYEGALQGKFAEMFGSRQQGDLIRGSNLGDPLAVLILKKLGYRAPDRPLTILDRHFLYEGHEAEARMISTLMMYGFDIHGSQKEVEYRGYKGHIDLMIEGETVVDVKAVKNASFNRMTGKKPYISDRYKTQVAFYKKGLGIKKGGLLVYNRDTSDIAFLDLSNDEDSIKELDYKLDVLDENITLEELFYREEEFIPEVKREVYKGAATGNYLLPDSMRFSEYKTAFYDLSEPTLNGYDREQIYVLGYKTLEQAREELEKWQVS
ncbi:related exonuclease [Arthronema virus TR020]|uniref:Related exonuclease n=1 Tax=Arthronema virus TR020 TaxID=2736280 RepID=A0A7G3WH42_9CAUD|nr:related exonuclease [Arthronema virus TR020]